MPANSRKPTTVALGRRPKVDKPALRLGELLTGVLPTHPIAVDNAGQTQWGLDANDRFGTCVPTGYDNFRRMTTLLLGGQQVSASLDQVFTWYRTQNPRFDPNAAGGGEDNGMVIQDFLAYLAKTGEILAFARVDHKDDDEMQAAVYLFLGLLWGVDLDVVQDAQMANGLWDYKAGSQDWGGHCVMEMAYEGARDEHDVITWQQRIRTSDAFRRRQLDECWVVIRPEHLANPTFREGLDLGALAAGYTAITGRPFPAAGGGGTPPAPPTTGVASFPGASAAVDTRLARAAARAGMTVAAYQENHWRRYFDF